MDLDTEPIRRRAWAFVVLAAILGIVPGMGGRSLADEIVLKAGLDMELPIREGQARIFRCFLRPGDLLDVVFDQLGTDLALRLMDPEGKVLVDNNNRPGPSGREYLRAEAQSGGDYRLECRPASSSTPEGRFRVKVRNILSADEVKNRRVEADARAYLEYYGNFELAPGRLISIGPTDEFNHGGKPVYVDTSTRRFGKMVPLADGSFYAPPAMDDDLTAETEIRFRRDVGGNLAGLEWTERGKPPVFARRVFPSRTEEVSFRNGDVVLEGILILPEGPGPHPALVFVHGSGPSLRNQGCFLSFFQRYGIAVLSFDKRGAGKSTGDWRSCSFDDLASDILAGVGFLKGRKDIDPRNIGLHGISQAGWIGSLAAARSPDVKFLIINTGSGVRVADNMAHELEGSLRNERLPEDQILEAREFQRTLLNLASEGAAWEKIQAWIAGGKDKPWFDRIRLAGLPEGNINWAWLRMNGDYDSAAALEKVKCPVLWFLADKDWNVPSLASRPRIAAALARAGNRDFTVLLRSPAAHVMFESATGFLSELIQEPAKFVVGYWDVLGEWLDRRITP